MSDELIVREGDEDVQYVLLDLPDAPKDPSQPDPFAPGARLAVRIDPATGGVRVSSRPAAAGEGGGDGDDNPTPLLEGRFEETVGSVLVVRPPVVRVGAAAAAPEGGDEERRTRPRPPREDDGGAASASAPPRPPAAAAGLAVVVATVESRVVRASDVD